MNASRKNDRKHAMCVVFSHDFHAVAENIAEDDLEYFLENFAEEGVSEADFLLREIKGVQQNLATIDRHIEETSAAWDIARISKIDLAIMRIAVYEILFEANIAPGVAINEAVELAKAFSTEDAGKFVNGVLGQIVRRLNDDENKSV